MATWLVLLVICTPWVGGLCVWGLGDKRPGLQHALASTFAVLGGLLSLGLLGFVDHTAVLRIPMGSAFGDFTLIPDGLGVYLAIIAGGVGSLAVIFSNDYMKGEAQLGRYYALVLLFIGAMSGLVLAGNLLLMFIFWEITAFCSYALISFHNDDPKAVAGGIKALIITQVGGVGLLMGALIAYTSLGSFQIDVFIAQAGAIPRAALAFVAFGFLIAAAAKSAQFPFQTWLPDAMEAPTPISALIHAATMVNAGVYLLARFYPAFKDVPGWTLSVAVVGLISALLAAVMAIVATDLKRTLAYSTISQLGYMVYAIGCGSVLASQFHLMSHSVFKALLFLGAGAVIHTVGTRDMRLMGGLGREMPFTRLVFIIGAAGLAGIPIANGFFSKELVLEGGLAGGPVWAYLGMLLGVGLTALYSLRMVWMVFYGPAMGAKHAHDAPAAMRISLGLLAFGTLVTWMLVGPFSQMLKDSLPFHEIHAASTIAVVLEIITAPATWIALLVVALGLAAWIGREQLGGLKRILRPLGKWGEDRFGFEWINQRIIQGAKASAEGLSHTQTGQLNWNVVGIVGGLVVILFVLAWGV
jgi:NADH-quinone oxidoreductase subunit L